MADGAVGPLPLCLDGLVEVASRLTNEFGLDLRWESLGDRLGRYCGTTRLVLINRDAPVVDQLWLLYQVQQLLTIGVNAVPDAVPTRRLRVV